MINFLYSIIYVFNTYSMCFIFTYFISFFSRKKKKKKVMDLGSGLESAFLCYN
jgi:hypothetical protein